MTLLTKQQIELALKSNDPTIVRDIHIYLNQDPIYFINTHVQIEDAERREWVPFTLWQPQEQAVRTIHSNKLTIVLKARQLGLSWLCLAYALWLLIFRPGSTVLLFSRRDDEAVDLLKHRLVGSYQRLPAWMRRSRIVKFTDHEFALANGSRAKAFPAVGGDSYSASLVLIDEADIVPDLDKLLRSAKPTIDAPSAKLILVSRADKSKPQSPFKRIYSAAKRGESPYSPIFLPWNARPDRDRKWYEEQQRDIEARTGALDDLHEQYPSTDVEALAPRSLDKRIPPAWLSACFKEAKRVRDAKMPAIPGLLVYAPPKVGSRYVVGADPAEGNPNSDDSAAIILDVATGEEAACLIGKFEPSVFAEYISDAAGYFNRARVMVERNNHGHAVLACLRGSASRMIGPDGKPGWLSNTRGKSLLYTAVAEAVRTRDVIIHNLATFEQIASIDAGSLRAPDGQHDDRADAFALACKARESTPAGSAPGNGGSEPFKPIEIQKKPRGNLRGYTPPRVTTQFDFGTDQPFRNS